MSGCCEVTFWRDPEEPEPLPQAGDLLVVDAGNGKRYSVVVSEVVTDDGPLATPGQYTITGWAGLVQP